MYVADGLMFSNFKRADRWAAREAEYSTYHEEPVTVFERRKDGVLEPVCEWSRHADH